MPILLAGSLADTVKARQMKSDGSCVRLRDPNQRPFSVQDFLIHVAEGKADISDIPKPQPAPEPKPRPKRPARQAAAAAD